MGVTSDPDDPCLLVYEESGQQKCYLVLPEDERAKGFVRPVRSSYRHLLCGSVTTMGRALSETYARDPSFYGGTFCAGCGDHFRLRGQENVPNFVWDKDGTPVGS